MSEETVKETAEEIAKVTIEKNGESFGFKRKEFKARGDNEPVTAWTIQNSPDDETPDEDVTEDDWKAYLDSFVNLLGVPKIVTWLQGRLDSSLKGAQLQAGKDNYDMAKKLDLAKAFATTGNFGENRGNYIGKLTQQLAEASNISKLQGQLISAMMLREAQPKGSDEWNKHNQTVVDTMKALGLAA